MSTTDLNILADAVTFAMMVTLGGIIVYAVARSTWKHHALRRSLKVGLSVAALVAVGIAGVAVWPAAREGVNTAAGVDLDESGDVIVPPEELALEGPTADLDHTKVSARPARLREVASVGTDTAIDPAPTSGGGTGGGGTGGGGNGGGGTGGGGDPSPTDEPSPTVDPSPTDEPSPTVDPSPTDEPSPTVDPSPTDEPSPTVDPDPSTEPPPPPPGV